MRSPTLDVYEFPWHSYGPACFGDPLGRGGITRFGAPLPEAATRRFHDYGGQVSRHDPFALRLTAGLIATSQIHCRTARVTSQRRSHTGQLFGARVNPRGKTEN